MRRILLIMLCSFALPVLGSHIVGGEFEMIYKRTDSQGNHRYNISLILYFDSLNGNPDARDPSVRVRIFRKRDNAIMVNDLLLIFFTRTKVKYAQPRCSSGSTISTDKLFYSYSEDNFTQAEFPLSPETFNDPGGYYISWERCCRNYGITNAFNSVVPGEIYAGQTFYLEFPPLIKNGKPFINSSPSLFPPLSDYACPNRVYFVDFGGSDTDGDSLAYSLITPLNTLSGDALPPLIPPSTIRLPRPGPYPPIQWRTGSGFSETRMMLGNPDLKISTNGLITVVPKFAGLYVFAVKCEEFRDGEKIGEVRRDFQILVLTECPKAQPPLVEAKPNDPNAAFQRDNISVVFSNVENDNSRCIIVRVSDPDSKSIDNGNQEEVTISAIPLGFKNSELSEILPDITNGTLVDGSYAEFNVCFPKCPYILGPYEIGIIVSDHACPLPLMDTIVVTVNVELPPNNLPYFDPDFITATVLEGSGFVSWNLTGKDLDPDSLVLKEIVSPLFSLSDYGFEYAVIKNVDGLIEARLTWDTRCDVIDFSKRINFPIRFTLNDIDECDLMPPDTLKVNLTMDLYNFNPPIIQYAPEPDLEEVILNQKVYGSVSFDVLGSDLDNDKLILTGAGTAFNMQDYGIIFPGDTNLGNVSSTFTWNILCDKLDLSKKNEYDFEFIVMDTSNRCHYHLADTLKVTVVVGPPENNAPIISANGITSNQELNYILGELVSLDLLGTDEDRSPSDLLRITLLESDEGLLPEGYTFQPVEGHNIVQGKFTWQPGCEIFKNRIYENQYKLLFKVSDDRCFSMSSDTVTIDLTIRDVESGNTDFIPPNFITPNGDNLNDFFAMVKLDETTHELVSILPNDNCIGRFVDIKIFNRWGKKVYSSDSRDFRWYADGEADGVYFYLLTYSDKEYKGLITVRD